jgi:hypothetical protein
VTALARALVDLDLVLTVDTLSAHLAGALAVPVWTLLEHDPGRRWLEDGADGPSYPTMRLFRQPAAGRWEAVAAAVEQALRAQAEAFVGSAAAAASMLREHVWQRATSS